MNYKERLKSKYPKIFVFAKRLLYDFKRVNPFISRNYLYLGRGRYVNLNNLRVERPRPNMFIVGAEKAATTSLHNYLHQHPEIFMSSPNKEPHYLMPQFEITRYFAKAGIKVRDKNDLLKNHMLKGYQGEKKIGESTTSYTRGANLKKFNIAEKLGSYRPKAKLIYIVRHPLDRIVSNYLHTLRETDRRAELNNEVNRSRSYLFTSLYGWQIEKLLEFVPAERIYVLVYEDFINNPNKSLRDICGFLEVKENIKFDTSSTFNVSKNRNNKDPHMLRFDEGTYTYLMKNIRPDISKFERITGKSVSWKFSKNDWVKP